MAPSLKYDGWTATEIKVRYWEGQCPRCSANIRQQSIAEFNKAFYEHVCNKFRREPEEPMVFASVVGKEWPTGEVAFRAEELRRIDLYRRLVAVVRFVEWGVGRCLLCRGYEEEGHTAICEIGALLKETDGRRRSTS